MEGKSYHIIIASVAFALLAWLSVNLGYEYTVVRTLPVTVENIRAGKGLKHPIPKQLSVRFRGNGWLLAGLYLSPAIHYTIDVSALGTGDSVITSRDVMEHVKLPVAVQVVSVKPETLLLALSEYKEKRVPVVPRLSLSFGEGYGQVGRVRLLPESVLVGGAKDSIDHLEAWETVYRRFTDLRASLDVEVPLEEPPDYLIDLAHSTARVRVNVQPFAEKVFTGIPLAPIAAPSNKEVIFIPPKMDVTVRGGIDQLAKLTVADFRATVEYQTLLGDSGEAVVPNLEVPDDIKVIRRSPETFQFVFRRRL